MIRPIALVMVMALPAWAEGAMSLDQFKQANSDRLLAGRGIVPDWRDQLVAMPPADRLEALIFLRRSGLLQSPAWPIEAVLAPPAPRKER